MILRDEVAPAVVLRRHGTHDLGAGRLSTGWRADLVGKPLQRLLAGTASIRLDNGGRRLKLEDR